MLHLLVILMKVHKNQTIILCGIGYVLGMYRHRAKVIE
nr:MAG TPA: hypothetical protein [Caudoviricetes sp.]